VPWGEGVECFNRRITDDAPYRGIAHAKDAKEAKRVGVWILEEVCSKQLDV
jgi:hypothetical protein